jgi:hypothetical protein
MLDPEPLVPELPGLPPVLDPPIELPEPLVPEPGPELPAAPVLAPPLVPPGVPELPLMPGVLPVLLRSVVVPVVPDVSVPDLSVVLPDAPPLLIPDEPPVLPPLVCAHAPLPIRSATAAVARVRYMQVSRSMCESLDNEASNSAFPLHGRLESAFA